MGFENVGRVWTSESFGKYLSTIVQPNWCKAITLHHTGIPSLASYPHGLSVKYIENAREYYKSKGWNSGPHLFIDEDQIFGMCDLHEYGIHAKSFNSSAIGIEVLGNYDQEDPFSGRGLACWKNAAITTRMLLDWLDLKASGETVLFHRNDPKTSKTCPGKKVQKDWVLSFIQQTLTPADSQHTETNKPDVGMSWSNWDFRSGSWCVPVYDFLMAKGVPSTRIITHLQRGDNGEIYYGQELIEDAYYVGANSHLKPNDCTWAPVRELIDLPVA